MSKLFFLIIIIIALLFRFWNLSSIPVSLSHDEVAIGYNAWSILKTGKDEYGNFLPILFRSFEDYKLPGYVYVASVSEYFFGLSSFAVRFPSAFFGTLTVVSLFFLIREITYQYYKRYSKTKHYLPYIVAFIFAISPWHINFSRAAFESNVSVFFIVTSIFLLFKSLRNSNYLISAAVFSVGSIYFYYTARVVLPLILLVFSIINYSYLYRVWKNVFIACTLGIVLLIPIFPYMFTSGLSRVNQVSVFEDKTVTNPYSEARLRNNDVFWSKIFYNRRIAYLHQFADNYLKNFAFDSYFTNGTIPMGLLYIWELPFFLIGIYFIIRGGEKWKWILLTWFLSVPLVGGLTTGQPNVLRTLPNAPAASIFSGFGVWYLYTFFLKKKYFNIGISLFIVGIVFFLCRFIVLYFDYQKNISAISWGDGREEMALYVKSNMLSYDRIYVTGDYWRPYIYYLFYSAYDPAKYQIDGSKEKIENLYFGIADWDKVEGIRLDSEDLSKFVVGRTLFILSTNDFKKQKSMIESKDVSYRIIILKNIDGEVVKPAFYAVVIK